VGYPWALALTLIVEVPIYTGLLGQVGVLRRFPAIVAAIGVNLVTHPLVWLATRHAGWAVFTLAEVGAWLVEAGLLYAVVRTRGRLLLAVALVANSASLLAGLVLAAVGVGR
jgi:hypothetical protein